ncbi:MAG TPA: hypothetical protein VN905_09885 [Candidatus Binatia bacterium]|nr:hypothetical protein [Candidatus Binatia bacterium]
MRFSRLVLFLSIAMLGTGVAAYAQQAPPPPVALPNANSPAVTVGDRTYRIAADVVTAGVGRPGVQGANCVNQTVFFPGDTIVFRAVIADGPTGTPLSTADVARLGVQAVVSLSDGSKVTMKLGSHPPPPNAPAHSTFWSGSIGIPASHPTGTLKWTLTATDKAGHAVNFAPMGQDAGTTVLTLAQKAPAAQ